MIRWAGRISCMVMRNSYKILARKPEGKSPLGRPKSRWGKNIEVDLTEVRYEFGEWIRLVQNKIHLLALVNTSKNLWVPQSWVNLTAEWVKKGYSQCN
jgi:hypothetical protein